MAKAAACRTCTTPSPSNIVHAYTVSASVCHSHARVSLTTRGPCPGVNWYTYVDRSNASTMNVCSVLSCAARAPKRRPHTPAHSAHDAHVTLAGEHHSVSRGCLFLVGDVTRLP